jgi:hypothetical protein
VIETFAFSRTCDWHTPEQTFQLGGGVTPADVPEFLAAFAAAKQSATRPKGVDWDSPLQMLASAELQDLFFLDREDGKWVVQLQDCKTPADPHSCRRTAISFGYTASAVQDLRGFWLD